MVIHLNELHIMIQQKSILNGICLDVKPGEFIGLIGPNGSGKTTLLKSIAGIQSISDGTLQIANKDIHTYKSIQLAKLISYVPQDTALSFDFTVGAIVQMGRHVHSSRFSFDDSEGIHQVEQAMAYTGISHLKDRSILSLSGGQQQLVFIAKALAQQTPIILLDEPISALDIRFQLQVLTMLKNLSVEGKTIIVVLHDLNLAARFCSKLMMLKEGSVLGYGPTGHVLRPDYVNSTYKVNAIIRKDEITNAISVTALSDSENNHLYK